MEFAQDGKTLLEKVEKYKPDLILLDVMMPEMNGPVTLEKLREKKATKDIPVIFITAKAQLHEVKNYENMGIIGVISKPFDPLTLATEIEELWNKNG